MTTVINEAHQEELREAEDIKSDVEVSDTDRIDAIEDTLSSQSKQIASIAEEQTKIADILENLTERISEVQPKVEDIEINDLEGQEINSIPEESEDGEESIEKVEENEIKESVENEAPETEESEVENSVDLEKDSEDDSDSTEEESAEEETQGNNIKENAMTQEEINALVEQVKNAVLDAQAQAPKFEEVEEVKNEAPAVAEDWRVRYNDQVAAAWDAYRLNNVAAAQKLIEINSYNASLKTNDAGTGPMTIESLDSFVLPPEVDTMIHGKRTNYSQFLNELEITQTNALTFAYATRVGDIDMQNVALCDDGKDGNLKPIQTYTLKQGVAQMEEMAAVTPICDNATKYLAADILTDVAAGYRNDYDRKLAQLAIIRMQQALNNTGNTVEFDPNDSVEALVDFIKATTAVSDDVVNGKFVFTAKTKAKLVEYIFRAAANGELGKDTMTTGEFQTIFGYPYVVVPNDLMPTLGETPKNPITFKATNNQTGSTEEVQITTPVFYGDLDEYRGKTSGALKYDVSAEASYEVNGQTRSAWQRNELILRGSFLRGGYIADEGVFAGLVPKA